MGPGCAARSRDDAHQILSPSFINHLWNKKLPLFHFVMEIIAQWEAESGRRSVTQFILSYYCQLSHAGQTEEAQSKVFMNNPQLQNNVSRGALATHAARCFEISALCAPPPAPGSAPRAAAALNELLIEVSLSLVWRTPTSVFILVSFVSDKFPITSWWKYNHCVLQMGSSGITSLFNGSGVLNVVRYWKRLSAGNAKVICASPQNGSQKTSNGRCFVIACCVISCVENRLVTDVLKIAWFCVEECDCYINGSSGEFKFGEDTWHTTGGK